MGSNKQQQYLHQQNARSEGSVVCLINTVKKIRPWKPGNFRQQ